MRDFFKRSNKTVYDVRSLPLCKAQNEKGRTCFYHVKSFYRAKPLPLRCASLNGCRWKSAYGGNSS